MATARWTRDQLKLAFHLYCQLPFGRLHRANKEVIQLAAIVKRTPSAVAMKLVNFASLDPEIRRSGRCGLNNASALDRIVWNEFHADWEGLALECARLRKKSDVVNPRDDLKDVESFDTMIAEDFTGETRRTIVEQRIKQHFFRRAVLSSYGQRCCMSDLSDPRLLIASHIVPWSKDKANRLNPSNGLCLSAIHDRAFDKGLITLSDDFRIVLSEQLKKCNEPFVKKVFHSLSNRKIGMPERFAPNPEFAARHRREVFVDR